MLTSLIYSELASIIYAPLRAIRRSAVMPLFSSMVHISWMTIATPSSLAYQNPGWLHFSLYITRLLV